MTHIFCTFSFSFCVLHFPLSFTAFIHFMHHVHVHRNGLNQNFMFRFHVGDSERFIQFIRMVNHYLNVQCKYLTYYNPNLSRWLFFVQKKKTKFDFYSLLFSWHILRTRISTYVHNVLNIEHFHFLALSWYPMENSLDLKTNYLTSMFNWLKWNKGISMKPLKSPLNHWHRIWSGNRIQIMTSSSTNLYLPSCLATRITVKKKISLSMSMERKKQKKIVLLLCINS